MTFNLLSGRVQSLLCTAIFFGLLPGVSTAQLDVQPNLTLEEYVNEVLLGDGISAFNITYTGGSNQLGKLINGADSDYAFDEGLVMSTANAKGIGCSSAVCMDCLGSSVTDSSLLAIANSVPGLIGQSFEVTSLYDVSILEFDFVASGDSVGFDYIFGSDEYNNWINTPYNDVFGFFLSGPGIEGPFESPSSFPNGAVNIAGVPGSDPNLPITVSSVNADLNSEYFIPNLPYQGICIHGYTQVFHAGHAVECGQTYHIKLAIADGSDAGVESVVILDKNSFTSPVPVVIAEEWQLEENPDVLFEGCGFVDWSVVRPEGVALDAPYMAVLSFDQGEAMNGVDFGWLMEDGTVSAFPDTLQFEAGEEVLTFTMVPIADELDEGSEYIVASISSITGCTEGFMYLTYELFDEPEPLTVNPFTTLTCAGVQLLVEPEVSGGYGNYAYSWECSNSTAPSILVTTEEYWECVLTVTDTCGLEPASGLNTITVLDSLPLVIDLLPDSIGIVPGDTVNAFCEVSGGLMGNGFYPILWYLNDDLVQYGLDTTYTFVAQYNDVLSVFVEDGCGNEATDEVVIEPLYDLYAVIDPLNEFGDGPDSLMNYSCQEDKWFFSASQSVLGSDSILYYLWNWGDGTLEYTLQDTVSHEWTEAGVYEVTLTIADYYESIAVSEPFIVTVYPAPSMTFLADSPICLGGTGQAEVTIMPAPFTQVVHYEGEDVHLADSVVTEYTFDLEVTGFSDDAVIEDCSDLKRVRAGLEHAHIGALDMWVTCPDGTELVLVSNNLAEEDTCNGGADVDGAYLGVPITDLNNDTAGTPFTYSWTPTGAYVLDDANNPALLGNTIVPGSYTSCSDWCALEGCPVNGTWTLHIATLDSLGDGHFFGWNLELQHSELDALGLGNTGVLDTLASGFSWGTFGESATIVEDSTSFSATYNGFAVGSHQVSFTAIDEFGCTTRLNRFLQVEDGLGFVVEAGPDPNACANIRPLTASLVNTSYVECPGMPYSNTWCLGNNVDTVFTICPTIQGDGTYMHVKFDVAQLDSIGEQIAVFDGPDVNSPLLGMYSGDVSNTEWAATNASGCLTFHVMTNDTISCLDGDVPPIDFTIDCNPFFLDVVWEWEPGEWVVDSTAQNTFALPGAPVTQFVVKAYRENEPSCFVTDTVNITTQLFAELLTFQPDCDVSNGTLVVDVDAPGVINPLFNVFVQQVDTATAEVIGDGTLIQTDGTPLAFTFLQNGFYGINVSNENCEFVTEVEMNGTENASSLPCGCTYPMFPNYDPEAILDDGSCAFLVCEDLAGVDFGACDDTLGVALVDGLCVQLQGCGWVVDGVDYSTYSFDTMGECASGCVSCVDFAGLDFGDCDEPLGIGLVGGYCMELQGCGWVVDGVDYSFYSFGSMASCKKSCTGSCLDLGDVDFGPCTDTLGVAIVAGACTQVQGCGWVVDGIDYSAYTFDTIESCESSCFSSGCPEVDYESWCEEYYEDGCPADLNDDGAITIQDLLEVIAVYGTDCQGGLGPQ